MPLSQKLTIWIGEPFLFICFYSHFGCASNALCMATLFVTSVRFSRYVAMLQQRSYKQSNILDKRLQALQFQKLLLVFLSKRFQRRQE